MTCEDSLRHLPDLEDGQLAAGETSALRAHLATCPRCREEQARLQALLHAIAAEPAPEPSPALRAGFQRRLAEEKRRVRQAAAETAADAHHAKADPANTPWLLRLLGLHPLLLGGAATCLLGVGLLAGYHLRPSQPAISEGDLQFARMQARLDTLEQVLSHSVRGENDAGRLLQTASLSPQASQEDGSRLNRLLGTLAFDPSTNVRLSALESLYAHAKDPVVRQGILTVLPRERSPLVQVAMVDFIAALHAPEAAPVLRDLISDSATDKEVREAARRVLATLPAPGQPAAEPTPHHPSRQL